jgi:RimJ/RimL family protein N-acetyltransferase
MELNPEPTFDPLRGRRFSLVPVTPAFHDALYRLSVTDPNSFRWRYHGSIPPKDVFERSLYAGVLVQFAMISNESTNQLAGLVVAYNADPQSDYCFLAAVADRKLGAGVLEGVALFAYYLLLHWPLRKIYLETQEYNVAQFQSAVASGLLKEEGRLKEHQFFAGRYWDRITYAMYRDDLVAQQERFGSLFYSEPSILTNSSARGPQPD